MTAGHALVMVAATLLFLQAWMLLLVCSYAEGVHQVHQWKVSSYD